MPRNKVIIHEGGIKSNGQFGNFVIRSNFTGSVETGRPGRAGFFRMRRIMSTAARRNGGHRAGGWAFSGAETVKRRRASFLRHAAFRWPLRLPQSGGRPPESGMERAWEREEIPRPLARAYFSARSMTLAQKTPPSWEKRLYPPFLSAMRRTDWMPIPSPLRLED